MPVISVEAGTVHGWSKYAHGSIGLSTFGASAPAAVRSSLSLSLSLSWCPWAYASGSVWIPDLSLSLSLYVFPLHVVISLASQSPCLLCPPLSLSRLRPLPLLPSRLPPCLFGPQKVYAKFGITVENIVEKSKITVEFYKHHPCPNLLNKPWAHL